MSSKRSALFSQDSDSSCANQSGISHSQMFQVSSDTTDDDDDNNTEDLPTNISINYNSDKSINDQVESLVTKMKLKFNKQTDEKSNSTLDCLSPGKMTPSSAAATAADSPSPTKYNIKSKTKQLSPAEEQHQKDVSDLLRQLEDSSSEDILQSSSPPPRSIISSSRHSLPANNITSAVLAPDNDQTIKSQQNPELNTPMKLRNLKISLEGLSLTNIQKQQESSPPRRRNHEMCVTKTPEKSPADDVNEIIEETPPKKAPPVRRRSYRTRTIDAEREKSPIININSPRKLRSRTPSTKCLENFQLISPQRRTSRKIIQTEKYKEHLEDSAGKRRNSNKKNQPIVENEKEEEDVEMEIDENNLKKSTLLFDQDADVAGHNLYSFRTPKKRDAMAQLAALTPKTPKTPQTPKTPINKSRNLRKSVVLNLLGTPRTPKTPTSSSVNRLKQTTTTNVKTPSRQRIQIKKALAKVTKPELSSDEDLSAVDESDEDFSANESDEYKPNDTVISDDSEPSGPELSSSDNDECKKIKTNKKPLPAISSINTTTSGRVTRSNARRQQDYVPQSDGYFVHQTNKKSVTSDRTLDRLKTPRLAQDHLFRLLAKTTMSQAHEKAIRELHYDYQQHFSKWIFILNEGFSILLHGLGSKRTLIQQFHEIMLSDQTVLVVNGFFPSLTIKDILDNFTDILNISITSKNLHEIVDGIVEELKKNKKNHIFLIVHNIDGLMLRNHKSQLLLSRLAKCKQIHLIASMDHINAPLLWDHTKLSNYNFSWWDVTTMLPYTEETAFENSMLIQNSGGLALSSMKNVFLSLTSSTKGIFMIIVKNQIENKGNPSFQGMPFKDIYSRCREDFLVSSDVALRSQLTEFIDHNLVKMKRTSDGTEHLLIPLDTELLQQFVEQQENSD